MALLEWLQATGLATWVREGQTIWAFPTILTLHTFGLGLLVGASAVVDLRLLGIGGRLPLAPLRPLFTVMWAGFWLNLVTGMLLFFGDATTRGTSALFWTKLVLVALGVASLVLIKRIAFDGPGPGAPGAGAGGLKRLAVLSLLVWTAAIVAGRLLAYV